MSKFREYNCAKFHGLTPRTEILQHLYDLGFEGIYTGGGCEALCLSYGCETGSYLLVTDSTGLEYDDLSNGILVGRYTPENRWCSEPSDLRETERPTLDWISETVRSLVAVSTT
jgi:hypothetical protein